MSGHDTHGPRQQLLDCPTCGLPAEITGRFVLYSTDGPLEHVKRVCAAGHWYTPPIDSLPPTRRHRAPDSTCLVGGIASDTGHQLVGPHSDDSEGQLNQEIPR